MHDFVLLDYDYLVTTKAVKATKPLARKWQALRTVADLGVGGGL
ncbi:MAG: hypothetical protein AAGH57_02055 [Pseudomonadota bacterium]